MNCECINTATERMAAHVKESGRFRKPVKRVEMKDIITLLDNGLSLNAVTATTFEIELEGQKKRETIEVAHNFCPFCGANTTQKAADGN